MFMALAAATRLSRTVTTSTFSSMGTCITPMATIATTTARCKLSDGAFYAIAGETLS